MKSKTSKAKGAASRTKRSAGSHERLVMQHVALLREILEHQVANLDNPHGHEFYRCYTYNTGDMPAWVKKAKKLVLHNADLSGVKGKL